MTDALCVLHSRPASDTCSRCGSFVCELCSRQSSLPGHCQRCTELLSPLSLRAMRAQLWASRAVSTAFIGAVSLLAGMLVDFYPLLIAGALLWLVAAALGALALLARRGTKASKVPLRSFVAIGLGLVAAVITAYVISLSMSV